MVQRQSPLQDLQLLKLLCVILKILCEKNIRVISNQLHVDDLPTLSFHYFDGRITLKNLEIVLTNNIKTQKQYQKLKRIIRYHFQIQKSGAKKKIVTLIYCKPTFSGIFTNLERFVLDICKCGLTKSLLHRVLDNAPIMGTFLLGD